MGEKGVGVGFGGEDVAGVFPGVGDGMDGAGDGGEEVMRAVLVAVGEGSGGAFDLVEAAFGGVVAVFDFVLDVLAVLECPAGGAAEIKPGVDDDAGEGGEAGKGVGEGLCVDGEGGGIVSEDARGGAVSDGCAAAEGVVFDGDVGGVGGIVGVGGGLHGPRSFENSKCIQISKWRIIRLNN